MPLEDELGEALRRAGNGFTADRAALVDAGERRGRRLVARRRAAVIGGSALALAVVATTGAYTGGLLGGSDGGPRPELVAAPPAPSRGSGPGADPAMPRTGTGAVTGQQLLAVFRELLPGGKLTDTTARGTGEPPYVSGVYDDGKGRAAVSLSLSRVDPHGSNARELTECGDKNLQEYDDCTTEQLADGSKVLLHQGYEYPDRRVDTKLWRAVLVTPRGYLVQASEWNAPAEKGVPVSRPNPPLTMAQLKTLVASDKWHPALDDLPPAERDAAGDTEAATALRDRRAEVALKGLLIPYGIAILSQGGQNEHGYAVLDDGQGKSLVQLSVQETDNTAIFTALFSGPGVTTQPDGTKVRVRQGAAEKGKGVVEWSVDTLREDGLRVLVSAYNTANQTGTATRETPALTVEQLKEIALTPGWNRLHN
ncbi:hypothetical protein [Streptomyces subrutilus]|uniref:Uncharacterized protein n=1 Tax=Streptomyces subrutilus TaxID=36818 RepID=A0A1E5PSM0_9ACTN|nr:hypothetical protein [Streptomyces subrutilus]OEJ32564.1 hypothetical protein BGK67_15595 [Streptomyces subrutilus]